jgi:hypothetical protein
MQLGYTVIALNMINIKPKKMIYQDGVVHYQTDCFEYYHFFVEFAIPRL